MTEYIKALLINPVQAHPQFIAAYKLAKSHLTAGRRLVFSLTDAESEKSAKQRAYYHKVVLGEIAAKYVHPDGTKTPMAAWKEHFRRKHLPDKRKKLKDPITGKSMTIRTRVSTEDLSVKKYNELIERVTAYAVTDLGIEFSERNIERWVDPETGEIFQ